MTSRGKNVQSLIDSMKTLACLRLWTNFSYIYIRPISCKKPVKYLTNRFHVAVRVFSNRSQMTSKCGKNKKVAHEAQPSVSLIFLPHFDVLCDLLLNRRTATWNLFVLYNKELKYTEKHAFFYFKFRHFDRHENSTYAI